MKYLRCAFCGKTISEKDIWDENKEIYMCLDNFLQARYFDENKDNIFCSEECACKALMIDCVFNPDLIPDDCWEEDEEGAV